MTIAQTATTSFKVQLPQGVHNFNTDTFYIALFTSAANIGPTTTNYTGTIGTSYMTGEVVGTGYTAGGIPLTVTTTPTSGSTGGSVAYWSFANAVWSPAAFTTRGALIYNSSQSNASVCVLDFGADKVCNTSFTIQFPAVTNTNAILRIA